MLSVISLYIASSRIVGAIEQVMSKWNERDQCLGCSQQSRNDAIKAKLREVGHGKDRWWHGATVTARVAVLNLLHHMASLSLDRLHIHILVRF